MISRTLIFGRQMVGKSEGSVIMFLNNMAAQAGDQLKCDSLWVLHAHCCEESADWKV
jgi:hypothetical protein